MRREFALFCISFILQVDYLDCTIRGGRNDATNDRYFLIVDAKKEYLFLTARAHPTMVLIESKIEGSNLIISTPDGKSINVNLNQIISNKIIRRAM